MSGLELGVGVRSGLGLGSGLALPAERAVCVERCDRTSYLGVRQRRHLRRRARGRWEVVGRLGGKKAHDRSTHANLVPTPTPFSLKRRGRCTCTCMCMRMHVHGGRGACCTVVGARTRLGQTDGDVLRALRADHLHGGLRPRLVSRRPPAAQPQPLGVIEQWEERGEAQLLRRLQARRAGPPTPSRPHRTVPPAACASAGA